MRYLDLKKQTMACIVQALVMDFDHIKKLRSLDQVQQFFEPVEYDNNDPWRFYDKGRKIRNSGIG